MALNAHRATRRPLDATIARGCAVCAAGTRRLSVRVGELLLFVAMGTAAVLVALVYFLLFA